MGVGMVWVYLFDDVFKFVLVGVVGDVYYGGGFVVGVWLVWLLEIVI